MYLDSLRFVRGHCPINAVAELVDARMKIACFRTCLTHVNFAPPSQSILPPSLVSTQAAKVSSLRAVEDLWSKLKAVRMPTPLNRIYARVIAPNRLRTSRSSIFAATDD